MYWLDNPLRVWRCVKRQCVEQGEAVRVCMDGEQICQYAGYLYRVNGNRFRLVKFGRAQRFFSYAELLGLCLSGKLSIDVNQPMPEFYRKYFQ